MDSTIHYEQIVKVNKPRKSVNVYQNLYELFIAVNI